MNRSKGFTLIELLVVIAIIGILTGVVITFVQSAKDRGRDATVKQQLGQLRSAMALLPPPPIFGYNSIGVSPCLDGNGKVSVTENLGLTVLGEPSIRPLIEAAAHSAGVYNQSFNASCTADNSQPPAWAVAIKLRSSANDWWCVDGEANSRLVHTGLGQPDPIDGVNRVCY